MIVESFLFDPAGTPGGGTAWGTRARAADKLASLVPLALRGLRMVVPQDQCFYARTSCAGIPLRGLAGFARLQAEQLSPFQNFGAYAVRQDQVLHVWMWDKTLEASFASQHPGRTLRAVVPQVLFSAPRERGVSWSRYVGAGGKTGASALLWRAGKLVDLIYFAQPPSSESWVAMLMGQPQMPLLGWPSEVPSGSAAGASPALDKPWARNLLVNRWALPRFALLPVARLGLWVATVVLAAASATFLTQRYADEKAIADSAENQKQRMAALEPQQQARDAAQTLGRWLASAQALSPRPAKIDLLNEAAVLLNRQGLVVRELELTPPTVSATLVPSTGAELRLTSVISAIETNPLFYDVRFVDVVGGNGFKFTWRLRSDARRLASLAPGATAGATGGASLGAEPGAPSGATVAASGAPTVFGATPNPPIRP